MTGKELKEYLAKKKVNVSEIARAMNLSPQALSERFKTKDVGIGFLREISRHTGISLKEFLEIEIEENILSEPAFQYGTNYKDQYMQCLEEKNELLKKLLVVQEQKELPAADLKK